MGQELFCYLVSVPREISSATRARAKEHVRELAEYTDADVDRIIDFLLNPEGCWDTHWRDELTEGRRVIVCGEATWGDTPGGPGFQMLADLYRLGLEKTLDVR